MKARGSQQEAYGSTEDMLASILNEEVQGVTIHVPCKWRCIGDHSVLQSSEEHVEELQF